MSDILDRADDLRAEFLTLLTAADGIDDPAKVLITSDYGDIVKHPTKDAGMLVLAPGPALTFPHPKVIRVTWRLDVIVGHMKTIGEEWARLALLVEILRGSDGINDSSTSVKPGQLKVRDSLLNGYSITFTDPDIQT